MSPPHQGHAIVLRIKGLGLPVVHVRDVTVQASCRFEGRAPGGMTSALRERAADLHAPLCPDTGRSEVPVLATLPPLRTPADLPDAVTRLERLLAA